MTNFLTQLAARTLELTPIVQPRIASVFASEVGQSSEATPSTQSTAAEIAGSAAPAAIAPQPLLVNSSRSTLLIAHLPRPIAPSLVPSATADPKELPEQSMVSLKQTQSVPDVLSVTSDRSSGIGSASSLKEQSEHDRVLQAHDRTEPAVTSERKFPLPSPILSSVEPPSPPNIPQSAAVPVGIERVSPPVLPGAVPIESAIALNELQAAQSPEPPSTPPVAIVAQPSDRQVTEGRISLSDQWVSGEAVKRQTAVSTAPPTIVQSADQTDAGQLALALPPLAVPRQAESVPPIVVSQVRSQSRQTREVLAAPPPTVQVTIGRIEVRTVPSAAPPRPRAATAPARLSLEAYLRSRSGGTP